MTRAALFALTHAETWTVNYDGKWRRYGAQRR